MRSDGQRHRQGQAGMHPPNRTSVLSRLRFGIGKSECQFANINGTVYPATERGRMCLGLSRLSPSSAWVWGSLCACCGLPCVDSSLGPAAGSDHRLTSSAARGCRRTQSQCRLGLEEVGGEHLEALAPRQLLLRPLANLRPGPLERRRHLRLVHQPRFVPSSHVASPSPGGAQKIRSPPATPLSHHLDPTNPTPRTTARTCCPDAPFPLTLLPPVSAVDGIWWIWAAGCAGLWGNECSCFWGSGSHSFWGNATAAAAASLWRGLRGRQCVW